MDPRLETAWLSFTEQPISVSAPLSLATPPASVLAVFRLILLFVSVVVAEPLFSSPPPSPAELSVIVEAFTITMPEALKNPPR